MHFCVFTVPDVASIIILYVSRMTAWAEIVWLLGMIESIVLLRNNSQSEEWGQSRLTPLDEPHNSWRAQAAADRQDAPTSSD